MYEIEIKSLLGSKKNADKLRQKLLNKGAKVKFVGQGKQRNHYFNEPKDIGAIETVLGPLLSSEKKETLSTIIENVKGKVSIRTREADDRVSSILKASIGDDSSANGVSRIEFDEPVRLTLEQLDKKLLDAGLSYQAKWSREREQYDLGSIHITVDKNAGYGYLAEFEKMIDDGEKAPHAREEIKALMGALGCEELSQARLERMFKHYNEHWQEYYGTERVFVIE